MRVRVCAVVTCLVACWAAAGCVTDHPGIASEQQGIAELRVDAASLQAAHVTRVTVEGAGQIHDLVFNELTATYDAAMFLPTGTQSIIARAFSEDVLVGASTPVSVNVQTGLVTRVVLRILDLTVEPSTFSPLFDSLTFPTTIPAGGSAAFALSVIAPAHDPVTYQWSSDCADSTFSAAAAATTTWSKPTEGSCRIHVVATSNGLSLERSFLIVVFAGATSSGALDISGVFVTGPQVAFALDQGRCFRASGQASDASCASTVAAPSTLDLVITVFSWGASTARDFELSDNCGGGFGVISPTSDGLGAQWMPPASGGACILTARAINRDAVATTLALAVLARPGVVPVTHPPQLDVEFGDCLFSTPPGGAQDCGVLSAGGFTSLRVFPSWQDGTPGIMTVNDDCGGGRFHGTSSFQLNRGWQVTSPAGTTCHLTVDAINLQGAKTTTAMVYRLL